MTPIQQIHQIAEWQTYRGTCNDCREKWATVCRLARNASQTEPEDCRGAWVGVVVLIAVGSVIGSFVIGWVFGG